MDDAFKRAAQAFDKYDHKRNKPKRVEIPDPEFEHMDLEDAYIEKPVKRPRAKLIWQVRAENKLNQKNGPAKD